MEPEYFMGKRCIVASYNVQRKTSRNRLLNWIFKKIYGVEEKSYLPDGTGCVITGDVIFFRSKELLESTLEAAKRMSSHER